MQHIPTFCIDNFYEDPDQIRDFALSLEFKKLPSCLGLRTGPMSEINPDFDAWFTKKLLSVFYNVLNPSFKYNVSNVFHKNYMNDVDNYTNCTPDNLIMGSVYGSEYRSKTSAHLDKNLFSGVIYLNKEEEMHAGTAIYRPVKYFEEHDGALLQETARFSQIYNRLVAFGGDTWHGRIGDNRKEDRLCHVFFIYHVFEESPLQRMRNYK